MRCNARHVLALFPFHVRNCAMRYGRIHQLRILPPVYRSTLFVLPVFYHIQMLENIRVKNSTIKSSMPAISPLTSCFIAPALHGAQQDIKTNRVLLFAMLCPVCYFTRFILRILIARFIICFACVISATSTIIWG